jgi:tRNA-2-methylthio-N6-dimethylallyladenosine synthase
VTARELPVLDLVPPGVPPGGPRPAAAATDSRVAEFRPEDQALPRFWIWTLGCQMNRSDSEEMAGRLLASGCAEAAGIEAADLVVINTCAIREAAEAKVVGRQGALAALKAANPALRVVLTGCAVRERDRAGLRRRFPAVDLFLRPDEEPELVERLGLASVQGPVGLPAAIPASPGTGPAATPRTPAAPTTAAMPTTPAAPRTAATALVKGVLVSAADHLAGSRADAVASGSVRRESAVAAWLPIIYGCDKTCTYCIVPFSRGPERSRPFDEVVEEARSLAAAGYREITLLGQNVNSYGHDLPAEGRFAHVAEARRAGQRIDRASRPDLAELIEAIGSLRGPDGRPAVPRLRFITSHPWDLSDRLVDAMARTPSVCAALHLPVQSGDDEVLRRMGRQYTVAHYQERLERMREAIPGLAVSTDVIVGFCGETEAQFQATLRLIETVRYDQVFAAAFSPRPGTPATRLPDDVPAAVKKERLNLLLARQEAIGFARNRERIGSVASVLVDTREQERVHDHDDGADEPAPATLAGRDPFAAPLAGGWVRLAGRSRENRLVHLAGPASLLGGIVDVRIEAAGPYSLRGVLA